MSQCIFSRNHADPRVTTPTLTYPCRRPSRNNVDPHVTVFDFVVHLKTFCPVVLHVGSKYQTYCLFTITQQVSNVCMPKSRFRNRLLFCVWLCSSFKCILLLYFILKKKLRVLDKFCVNHADPLVTTPTKHFRKKTFLLFKLYFVHKKKDDSLLTYHFFGYWNTNVYLVNFFVKYIL